MFGDVLTISDSDHNAVFDVNMISDIGTLQQTMMTEIEIKFRLSVQIDTNGNYLNLDIWLFQVENESSVI